MNEKQAKPAIEINFQLPSDRKQISRETREARGKPLGNLYLKI